MSRVTYELLPALVLLLGCEAKPDSGAPLLRLRGAALAMQTDASSARAPAEPAYVASRGTLVERLAAEAASRPERTIAVEDLLAALNSQEIEVVRTRQVLASPVGARYCTLLVTASGASGSLCEFGSEAEAQRAGARSAQRFDALIPNRELVAHDNALLTVLAPPTGPAPSDAGAIVAAFRALRPRAREHVPQVTDDGARRGPG